MDNILYTTRVNDGKLDIDYSEKSTRELIRKAQPLTENYEYASEIGMFIRSLQPNWWSAFERENPLSSVKSFQAAGFAFMKFLEKEADDLESIQELEDAILNSLKQSATRLKMELLATNIFLEQNFSFRNSFHYRKPNTDISNSIFLYKSKCLGYAETEELDTWIEEILDPYDLIEQNYFPAVDKEIYRAHSKYYIDGLEELESKGKRIFLTPETFIEPGAKKSWISAAGTVLTATRDSLKQFSKNPGSSLSICWNRPGSHHAETSRAGGTCLVNNLAIGAHECLYNHRLKADRVAILDIDAHHGNGTQEIFYSEPDVLTVSVHQAPPFFPGTGERHHTGEREANNRNKNIPISQGEDWRLKVEEGLMSVARFHPKIVFVQLSGDAHALDPVSDLKASTEDFAFVGKKLREMNIPIVAEIGASTNEEALRESVQGFIEGYSN